MKIESTLPNLYDSAVAAFPNTTKRQHATHPVKITKLEWTPWLGVKTLLVKGHAINEDREYNTLILFKNIAYQEGPSKSSVTLNSYNKKYYFEQINFEQTNVLVRCSCPDFYWRFCHFDHLDKSLYGRNRAKYEAKYNPGSANPMELPGMCKHVMVLISTLLDEGIVMRN